MALKTGGPRPLWRAPATVLPLVLAVLALGVLWQVRAAESQQARDAGRIAELDRKAQGARGQARKALRAQQAALEAEAERHGERAQWLTWLLAGLMLPAAGLLLVTGVRRREEEGGRARRDERRLQALVQHSTDMIVVIDRRGTIATQTGQGILGHRPGELQRRKLASLVHREDKAMLEDLLAGVFAKPRLDWRLQHKDGAWIHVETAIADMRNDPDIGGIILTSRDVTERKASEDQLRHRAFHDPLTQLPNRALFYDRIEHALLRAEREGHRVAVCMLDLDDFKGVNDTLGHAAGDELLVAVAQRLRGCLRSGDTAARLGGDEFGVLLEGVGERSEPIQVAERLLSTMRRPFTIGGETLDVRPSIGVATAEVGDDIVEDLLRHGDVAMYAAKRNGKARYEVYDEDMTEATGEHAADGDDESVAVERMPWFSRVEEQRAEVLSLLERPENLTAMYQPLLDLRTARIAGFEALARFNTPTHRPPNVWFTQAQRAGLGARLEAAALRTALSTPGRTPAAFLSLNVSPSALASDEVREALPDDLSDVVVEITENELVSAAPTLEAELQSLRERGARIAVDDAGAGYAGFTQLLRIRPHIIKLDRALVHGVAEDDYRAALIASFVGFARSIDALICAEGIETLQDLRRLADLDVTYGQGYALAPPGRAWPEVTGAATESCYAAWQAALHGHAAIDPASSGEARLERVAARIATIRAGSDVPSVLEEAARHIGAERAALRRVRDDGSLATLGGAPLTAGRRLDANRPEFADAGGRLLVLRIEVAGHTEGVLELLAPEGRPWHRNEIHRARVLAQLFAPVMAVSGPTRVAA